MKIHLTANIDRDKGGDHYVVDAIELAADPKDRLSAQALALLIQSRRDALDSFAHHLRREIAKLDKKQAEADVARLEAKREER